MYSPPTLELSIALNAIKNFRVLAILLTGRLKKVKILEKLEKRKELAWPSISVAECVEYHVISMWVCNRKE